MEKVATDIPFYSLIFNDLLNKHIFSSYYVLFTVSMGGGHINGKLYASFLPESVGNKYISNSQMRRDEVISRAKRCAYVRSPEITEKRAESRPGK